MISRDLAKAMNVKEGSEVRITLVGRQVAAVLRRHGRAFERLAASDRGQWSPPRR